jgi:hypothetical protein
MDTMKPTIVSYIAGIMDGEGCFYIERFALKKKNRHGVKFQYRVMATVTMCDKETIDFICAMTGRRSRKRRIKSGRTAYTIDWRNGIAAEFIATLLPYLVGKREQAEWCITFNDQLARGRGRPVTKEMERAQEFVRRKLQRLKR